jgi:uncharacterized protein (UPF0305 family)
MENKHPEHFWSAQIFLSENKKKIDFRNILNHFFFEYFITWIYDIVNYKQFFRDHNNLVIPKKKKNISKKIFFIIISKISSSHQKSKGEEASIVKAYSNRETSKRQEATGSNSTQVSSAILHIQVTCFIIYFTYLF